MSNSVMLFISVHQGLAGRGDVHGRVVVHPVAADAVRLDDRPLAIHLQELLVLSEQDVLAGLQPGPGDDVVLVAEEVEDVLLVRLVAPLPLDDLVPADGPGDAVRQPADVHRLVDVLAPDLLAVDLPFDDPVAVVLGDEHLLAGQRDGVHRPVEPVDLPALLAVPAEGDDAARARRGTGTRRRWSGRRTIPASSLARSTFFSLASHHFFHSSRAFCRLGGSLPSDTGRPVLARDPPQQFFGPPARSGGTSAISLITSGMSSLSRPSLTRASATGNLMSLSDSFLRNSFIRARLALSLTGRTPRPRPRASGRPCSPARLRASCPACRRGRPERRACCGSRPRPTSSSASGR